MPQYIDKLNDSSKYIKISEDKINGFTVSCYQHNITDDERIKKRLEIFKDVIKILSEQA